MDAMDASILKGEQASGKKQQKVQTVVTKIENDYIF